MDRFLIALGPSAEQTSATSHPSAGTHKDERGKDDKNKEDKVDDHFFMVRRRTRLPQDYTEGALLR